MEFLSPGRGGGDILRGLTLTTVANSLIIVFKSSKLYKKRRKKYKHVKIFNNMELTFTRTAVIFAS